MPAHAFGQVLGHVWDTYSTNCSGHVHGHFRTRLAGFWGHVHGHVGGILDLGPVSVFRGEKCCTAVVQIKTSETAAKRVPNR